MPPTAVHAADPAAGARAILASLDAATRRLREDDRALIARQVEAALIPAPTGAEGARAEWFASQLRALGIQCARDEAGNVSATFGVDAAGAPVVVMSHLDTVFSATVPLRIDERDGRLACPGISDNARGLAVMLAIAGVLARACVPLRRPVVLVATVGEEGAGDLRGAKHWFARRPRAHAAIALDGAGDDRIVHEALGSRRFRIGIDGPGGHSWSAFGAPNAITAAAACAARLARLPLPPAPRTTLSVGRIGGGSSVNAIPAHAWLEVDARSTDAASLDALEREIRKAVSLAVAEENDRRLPGTACLASTIERFGERPPGVTPSDHPLVVAAAAITEALGLSPMYVTASTDANVPMSLGIPAIAIGGGGIGGDAHTEQEWFANEEGPRGVARALAIIVAAANLPIP